MKLKERFARFMQGRYGNDELNKFLLMAALVVFLLSLFTDVGIFYTIGLILLILSYVRMFSKNIYKRYDENQTYLAKLNRVKQMKDYRFFKCPVCKQTVRVPRGKGKIKIHCPKCHNDFVKKS